jgi:hypothetical protein
MGILERAKRGCLVKSRIIHWARVAAELRWLGVERFSLRQLAPRTRIFTALSRDQNASFTHAFANENALDLV